MNATQSFSQPRQKLRRAEFHIGSLEAAIERYFSTDWYTCEFRRNQEGQYNLKIVTYGIPEDFSLIVGDVVHNLRTALDLLAVEVVGRNGGNTKGVYFPFAGSAKDLDIMIARRNFDRASTVDRDLVRSLQPYTGGNYLLRSLHDLDIQDKHHSLIPHTSLVTSPKISVKLDAAGNPIGFREGRPELEVDTSEPPSVKFTFPPDSPFAGEEVPQVLRRLHKHVADIIDQFASVTVTPGGAAA